MKSLKEKIARRRIETAIALFAATASGYAGAQNIRGDATGPTSAPGDDHPGQYLHVKDVKPADNMYPQSPGWVPDGFTGALCLLTIDLLHRQSAQSNVPVRWAQQASAIGGRGCLSAMR